MSDDSTRKVDSEEMERLQALLEKVEAISDVKLQITAELYVRVNSVMSLCDLEGGNDDLRFAAAVNQLFEAGLREYEARLAMV